MENELKLAFKKGVEMGTTSAITAAAHFITHNCKHRFFCHCKKIAEEVNKIEVSVSSVDFMEENERPDNWADVIDDGLSR